MRRTGDEIAFSGSSRIVAGGAGRWALAAALAATAAAATGCRSTATTTSLNVTVQTDLTTLQTVTIVATAAGRQDLTTKFNPVPTSIHWMVEIPNVKSEFDVLLTATGNTSDGQTPSYAALAMVVPGKHEDVLLKLSSACVGPQAPACSAGQMCDAGSCVPTPVLPGADASADGDQSAGTGGNGGTGGSGSPDAHEAGTGTGGTGGSGSPDAHEAGAGTGGAGTGGNGDAGQLPPPDAADAGNGPDTAPPPGSLGASCGPNQSCNSGNCVKGICCNTTCTTGCYSCVAADTGGAPGTCLPLQAGKTDGTCTAMPEASCGQTGACDGQGACQLQPTTVECVSEICSGTSYTSAAYCDGHGVCPVSPTSTCGPYLCDEGQHCKTSCTVDIDCAPESFCSTGGQCIPAVCTTDDWCWHNPRPFGSAVSDIWGPSSNDIWAVAAYGAIAHWDGTIWRGFKSVTPETLTAVYGAGGVVWAVGTAGTIVKWDGFAWRRVTSGIDGDLLDVWASDANNAWAVGPPGIALHWDGTSWNTVSLPTPTATSIVTAVSGRTPTDVWATSDQSVLHWDGQSWTMDTFPIPAIPSYQIITAILPLPSGDVWAASADDGGSGSILERTSQGWSLVATTDAQDSATLAVSPSGRMWASSGRDGSNVYSWNPLMGETPTAIPALIFLSLSPPLAFADDDIFFASPTGVSHWDQVSLVETFVGPRDDFSAVSGAALAPNNGTDYVLAAGNVPSLPTVGTVYSLQANTWTKLNPPLTSLGFTSVAATAGGTSWIVGEGPTFMGWYGEWLALTPSSTDSGDELAAVASNGNGAWAVGSNGRIWSYADDALNRTVASGTTASLTDIVIAGVADIWAVGTGGTIVHSASGGPFTPVQSGTTTELSGICANSPQDLWAVGPGIALHGDGTSWTPYTQATIASANLIRVACLGSEIWAIDLYSGIWHYSNSSWTESIPDFYILRDISATPNAIWVAGYDGTILRKQR